MVHGAVESDALPGCKRSGKAGERIIGAIEKEIKVSSACWVHVVHLERSRAAGAQGELIPVNVAVAERGSQGQLRL